MWGESGAGGTADWRGRLDSAPLKETEMKLVADVKCYHCGHMSGEVIGERNQSVKDWTFEPRSGVQRLVGAGLRCNRCEGPIYMEDLRKYVADEPARVLRRRMATLAGAA